VFVVDDEPDMCESIGLLLDSARLKHRSFTDPAEFLRRIVPEAPGCILLDVRMPRLSGLEVQQRLLRHGARQPVVFVSGHGDIPIALRAVRAGALDFIEKPFRAETLLEAVRHALDIDRLRREGEAEEGEAAARVAALSPREREVGYLVADGAPSREIAEQLGLSPRTVEMHRARAMKALGVKTTAEMIRVLLAARGGPAGDAED
jgi:FixJ family two-component response regulator